MTSRPVISYDDITLPYEPPEQPKYEPPQKKRRRNNHSNSQKKAQQWDDNDPDGEESRELTHEEIWDDSALIEAWNSAMEEYEVLHGPDKGWKKEPVHKSPLWYNTPPKNPSNTSAQSSGSQLQQVPASNGELDSQPLDFESFVPTHDPSLSGILPTTEEQEQEKFAVPLTSLTEKISQDEAFERAVQASYWSGYWTAVYHCHRQNQPQAIESTDTADTEEREEDDEDEMEEFVSTQR